MTAFERYAPEPQLYIFPRKIYIGAGSSTEFKLSTPGDIGSWDEWQEPTSVIKLYDPKKWDAEVDEKAAADHEFCKGSQWQKPVESFEVVCTGGGGASGGRSSYGGGGGGSGIATEFKPLPAIICAAEDVLEMRRIYGWQYDVIPC